MADIPIPGSCCCGTIRFELLEAPSMMARCHCSRCRKLGADTFVFVRNAQVRLLAGTGSITRYAPEPPYTYTRSFCARCGTALGELGSDADTYPIAADTLDGDPGVRVKFHEFVAEKPAWVTICDKAKQFERHPVKA